MWKNSSVFTFLIIFGVVLTNYIDLDFHLETVENGPMDEEAFGRHLSPVDIGGENIEISNSAYNRLMVELCVGTPKQCISAKLTSSSPYVWLCNSKIYPERGFDESTSSTFKQTQESLSIPELYGYVKGPVCLDSVQISNYPLTNFPFLLTGSEFKYQEYQGAVGLGYIYNQENSKYSFLDKLHESLSIDNKMFYLKYTSNTKGIIRLGSFPEEAIQDPRKYAFKQCDLLQTKIENQKELPNNRWECALKGVYFGTPQGDVDYILINDRVQFSLGSNINSFPKEVFHKFVGKYFKKYIDTGECALNTEMKYLDYVVCNKDFNYDKLGEVSYILGSWSLKFQPKDLFSPFNGKIRFGIFGHKGKQVFLLGYYLFKKYLVVFDKAKNKMGVYLNNLN